MRIFAAAIGLMLAAVGVTGATAQTQVADKHVWCIARQDAVRFHSKVGSMSTAAWNATNFEIAFNEALAAQGAKGLHSTCHTRPALAEIHEFRQWSLTAKTQTPLEWKEVDWTPR